MTATASAGAPATHRVSVARGYRFELVKLLAQWRVRVLILLCWIGPGIAVIAVSGQGTLPSDTLFGREMYATGWAGALVVLSFAGSWVFPLLTSVVAGDVFSAEDRLGTWRHLLVAVRSPRRIFVTKALASLTVLMMCLPGLAVSGIVGGLVVGSRPLTGLDGHQLSPADAAGRLLLAWLCVLAPILAFAAIGLLASVIFGRSPIGILLPAFGGLGMQLASQVLSMPVAVRLTLPSFAFLSWNGLFTSPPTLGPLLAGIAVSLAWAVTATALAYVLFMRRDFTSLANDGSMRRAITFGILPLLGVWALSAGVLAAATGAYRLRDRRRPAAAVAGHVVRPYLPPAEPGALPQERHRGGAAGQDVMHQGGRHGRPGRPRNRLALHRQLASARFRRGHRGRHLSARRQPERAIRRRRRRAAGSQRLLHPAHILRRRT